MSNNVNKKTNNRDQNTEIYRAKINKLNSNILPHLEKYFIIEPENIEEAYHVLKDVNFEHFKPYYYMFERNQKKPSFINDFVPIYREDFRVRALLFSSINNLEISLRTRFLYYLTKKYGDYAIWNEKIFMNSDFYQQYKSGIKHIFLSLQNSDVDADEYITEKYARENFNSFVALEHSQLGNLIYSMLSLSDSDLSELIEQQYDTKFDLDDFKNWLFAIMQFRNRLAHFKKIIDENIMFSIDYKKYKVAPQNIQEGRNKKAFFNYLIVYKLLVGHKEFSTLVNKIVISVHDERILEEYGFPAEWKDFI